MPIYEFRCNLCQKLTSILAKSVSQRQVPPCPACGSRDMVQVISSFAYHKSEATRRQEAGEPSLHQGLDYYKDPRNIGRWTEKRFRELGVEMPRQAQEMIAAARDGELPEPVKDL